MRLSSEAPYQFLVSCTPKKQKHGKVKILREPIIEQRSQLLECPIKQKIQCQEFVRMLELNEQDKSLCAPSIAIFSMNKHQDRIDQMIAREMHLKKQLNDSVDRFSGKACLKLYEAQRKNQQSSRDLFKKYYLKSERTKKKESSIGSMEYLLSINSENPQQKDSFPISLKLRRGMCRKADIMSQKMLHLPPFRKKREKSETEASEISHLNKQSKDTFTIDLSCLKEKSTPTFFGDTKIFREKLSPKSQIGKIDSGMSDKRQIKGCIVRRFKPFKLQQMNKQSTEKFETVNSTNNNQLEPTKKRLTQVTQGTQTYAPSQLVPQQSPVERNEQDKLRRNRSLNLAAENLSHKKLKAQQLKALAEQNCNITGWTATENMY